MNARAESTFQVTKWEEKPFDEMDGGPRLTRARVTKVFQGELEGDGRAIYLMTHRPDGTATFVGIERVTGRVDGRAGSFVLDHRGTFEDGVAKAECTVVPGTGTGKLASLRGRGSFAADGKKAPFTLEYELDE